MTNQDIGPAPSGAGHPGRAGGAPRRYRVEISRRFDASALRGAFAPTSFQTESWLETWYATLAARPEVSPLLVVARDGGTGELALALPLITHRISGLRVIEFADLELTDYNAPLLGPAAPDGHADTVRLWRAVRRALPRADLLRLAKMEAAFGQRPNPLASLPSSIGCALNGNVVRIGDDYDAWVHTGLDSSVRRELHRSWRVFSKSPGARYARITDPEQAQTILRQIESRQERRMAALGTTYFLNEPEIAEFYRRIATHGLADGSVVMTALLAGDGEPPELVAGLIGLRQDERFVMIRLGQSGAQWAKCSPGRLVMERTFEALHAEGVRLFDFSVGNYDYKRRFGVEPLPLVDVIEPLSWRGIVSAARAQAVGRLRAHPELDRRLRGWLGRFSFGKVEARASRSYRGATRHDG